MRKISVISLLFISFLCLQAQNDVILTIGNEKINQSEFERVYLKNNKPTTPDKKSISEYLDLYVNFRLKVLEAKSKGLDTLESFRSELMGYRDQLAKPYLNDTTILELSLIHICHLNFLRRKCYLFSGLRILKYISPVPPNH